MACGVSVQTGQDAQALPTSGQCSKSTGEWICNVADKDLEFYKTDTITQSDVSSAETIGLNISSLQTFRYFDVYVDGTTRIDANVTITDLSGTPELDTNNLASPHDKTVLGALLRNGENLSFTIDFINAATNEPVTMLNIELRVQDLDGGTRPENVVFQGLSSYTLSNPTIVSVNPSTAPSPESGQRIFSGTVGNSDNNNPAAAVSAKFDSVSSLRLQTYVTGSSGSAGIIFKFGPSAGFWAEATKTTTSVGYGNYTVSYDANGGDGTVPTAATTAGNQTLSSGSNLVKSSIPISSWNTQSDGTGQTLALGASFLPSGNTTLYAQYSSQTVTFDANQGAGTMQNQVSAGPTNLSSNTFSRSGYSFTGWNTSSDGTGANYANSSSYPFSISETLFAQWTANSNVVTYDEAGGSTVADGSFLTGGSVTLPSAPSRAGYSFAGWFRAASGGSALTSPYSPPDTSAITVFAQWTSLPAQTVTWAPTNTSLLLSESSVTPSSAATTSGDGAVTYSVSDAGATGCSVNSNTGVVTFTGVGECTIRATAASTQTYLTDTQDVVFSISSSAPAMSLNLDMAAGTTVANSSVDYAAAGLQNNSAWTLIVRSDPQTIASGTFSGTLLNGSAQLPAGLEAGWHSITLTGIGPSGNTISQAVWFEVSSSGTLLQTSGSEPASTSSNGSSASGLANTGNNSHPGALALLILAVGLALVMYKRRREAQ
jgi:uncharacterized repeat protein (TIGR02543 family)